MRKDRPAETAAEHVCPVTAASLEDTVEKVRTRLDSQTSNSADIYVTGAGGVLAGCFPLARLVAAAPGSPVSELIASQPITLPLTADQELVALQAVHHRLSAVPIHDAQGRFVGVVPAPALLEILHREHVEDLHRLAGIRRETAHVRHALEDPPARRAWDRLPWLLVGLVGTSLAALVMARFERILATQVSVAFFIPGIVYLADAIGTQTEAVVVRYLSLSRGSFRRVVFGEIRTGVIIGAALGCVALPAVAIAMNDLRLATAVALSIFAAGALATSIGLFFPFFLASRGKDPAFGSGPLATILQDVLSLLVYFVIASALLE